MDWDLSGRAAKTRRIIPLPHERAMVATARQRLELFDEDQRAAVAAVPRHIADLAVEMLPAELP